MCGTKQKSTTLTSKKWDVRNDRRFHALVYGNARKGFESKISNNEMNEDHNLIFKRANGNGVPTHGQVREQSVVKSERKSLPDGVRCVHSTSSRWICREPRRQAIKIGTNHLYRPLSWANSQDNCGSMVVHLGQLCNDRKRAITDENVNSADQKRRKLDDQQHVESMEVDSSNDTPQTPEWVDHITVDVSSYPDLAPSTDKRNSHILPDQISGLSHNFNFEDKLCETGLHKEGICNLGEHYGNKIDFLEYQKQKLNQRIDGLPKVIQDLLVRGINSKISKISVYIPPDVNVYSAECRTGSGNVSTFSSSGSSCYLATCCHHNETIRCRNASVSFHQPRETHASLKTHCDLEKLTSECEGRSHRLGMSAVGESPMMEVSRPFLLIMNRHLRVIFVSRNIWNHLGYQQCDVLGHSIGHFLHPNDLSRLLTLTKPEHLEPDEDAVCPSCWTGSMLTVSMRKPRCHRPGVAARETGYMQVHWKVNVRLNKRGLESKLRDLVVLCRSDSVYKRGYKTGSRHDQRCRLNACDVSHDKVGNELSMEEKVLDEMTCCGFKTAAQLSSSDASNCLPMSSHRNEEKTESQLMLDRILRSPPLSCLVNLFIPPRQQRNKLETSNTAEQKRNNKSLSMKVPSETRDLHHKPTKISVSHLSTTSSGETRSRSPAVDNDLNKTSQKSHHDETRSDLIIENSDINMLIDLPSADLYSNHTGRSSSPLSIHATRVGNQIEQASDLSEPSHKCELTNTVPEQLDTMRDRLKVGETYMSRDSENSCPSALPFWSDDSPTEGKSKCAAQTIGKGKQSRHSLKVKNIQNCLNCFKDNTRLDLTDCIITDLTDGNITYLTDDSITDPAEDNTSDLTDDDQSTFTNISLSDVMFDKKFDSTDNCLSDFTDSDNNRSDLFDTDKSELSIFHDNILPTYYFMQDQSQPSSESQYQNEPKPNKYFLEQHNEDKPNNYFLEQHNKDKPNNYFLEQHNKDKPNNYFLEQHNEDKPNNYFLEQHNEDKPNNYFLEQHKEDKPNYLVSSKLSFILQNDNLSHSPTTKTLNTRQGLNNSPKLDTLGKINKNYIRPHSNQDEKEQSSCTSSNNIYKRSPRLPLDQFNSLTSTSQDVATDNAMFVDHFHFSANPSQVLPISASLPTSEYINQSNNDEAGHKEKIENNSGPRLLDSTQSQLSSKSNKVLSQMTNKNFDPFLSEVSFSETNAQTGTDMFDDLASETSSMSSSLLPSLTPQNVSVLCQDKLSIFIDRLSSNTSHTYTDPPESMAHGSFVSECLNELDSFLYPIPLSPCMTAPVNSPTSNQSNPVQAWTHQDSVTHQSLDLAVSNDSSDSETSSKPSLLRTLLDKEQLAVHGPQTYTEWVLEEIPKRKYENEKTMRYNESITSTPILSAQKKRRNVMKKSRELPKLYLACGQRKFGSYGLLQGQKATKELPLPSSIKATINSQSPQQLQDISECGLAHPTDPLDRDISSHMSSSDTSSDLSLPDDLLDMAMEYCSSPLDTGQAEDLISDLNGACSWEDNLYSLLENSSQDKPVTSSSFQSGTSEKSVSPTLIAMSHDQASNLFVSKEKLATPSVPSSIFIESNLQNKAKNTQEHKDRNIYHHLTSFSQTPLPSQDFLTSPKCSSPCTYSVKLPTLNSTADSINMSKGMSLLRAAIISPDVDKLIEQIPFAGTKKQASTVQATSGLHENEPDIVITKVTGLQKTKVLPSVESPQSRVNKTSSANTVSSAEKIYKSVIDKSMHRSSNPATEHNNITRHGRTFTTDLPIKDFDRRPRLHKVSADSILTVGAPPCSDPLVLKFRLGANAKKIVSVDNYSKNSVLKSICRKSSLDYMNPSISRAVGDSTTDFSSTHPISVMIMRKEHHRSRRSKSIAIQTDNLPGEVYPEFEHNSSDTILYPSVVISYPPVVSPRRDDSPLSTSISSNSGMSELEKFLLNQSSSDDSVSSADDDSPLRSRSSSINDSYQLRPSSSFLLKLLTGELNKDRYQRLDQQLLEKERNKSIEL